MKINYIIIVSLITIISIALLVASTSSSAMLQLSGKDFIQKYTSTENAVLLDVRTPSEFAAGHIDKAINIDFENQTFVSEIQKLDNSKTYFVYCRSGNRSGKAITLMKNNGFKSINELSGGIISNTNTISLVSSHSVSTEEYVVDASDMIQGQTLIAGIKKSVLTKQEIDGLIQMREEEKLAHDVYVTLGGIWGVNTFSNISQSEQTHTDAIKSLLIKYEIPDPVKDTSVGVFHSKAMQDLYTSLVAEGNKSLVSALTVGVVIEDLDIHDLDILKAQTDKEDILVTYNNLQKGSRNHMRAFTRSLVAQGGTYTAKYISQNDYNAIIASPQERGRQ